MNLQYGRVLNIYSIIYFNTCTGSSGEIVPGENSSGGIVPGEIVPGENSSGGK